MLCVFAACCAGILVARSLPSIHPAICFALAALILTGIALPRVRGRAISSTLLISIVLLSTGWTTQRMTPSRHALDTIMRSHADHSQSNAPIPIEVRGMLVSRVVRTTAVLQPSDPPRWSPIRRTTELSLRQLRVGDDWIPASGRARVVLPDESDRSLNAGQSLTLIAIYRPPGERRNPGDPDSSTIAIQNGRVGTLYVEHDDLIQITQHIGVLDRALRVFYTTRASLRSRAARSMGLEQDVTNAESTLMGALILGQRTQSFSDVYESFQRVGVAHMLAISGFHVAVMLAFAVLLVRTLGEYPKLEAAIVILILAGILLLLPLRPPILRAVLIVVILMGASRFGRCYDRVTILLLIATALLIHRPMDLFSLGYQLSIGITAFLLMLPRSTSPEFPRTKHAGIVSPTTRNLWRLVRTNTACWMIASPTIMFHTGILSIIAPISALLMLPFILLMMIAGYAKLALGMISPALSEMIEPISHWISSNSIAVTLLLDNLPGSSVRVPNLGAAWTIIATAVLVLLVRRPSSRRSRAVWIATVVLLGWAASHTLRRTDDALLRVDMLDVGNGSCFVIRSGNESVLFDCGSLDRRLPVALSRAAHALDAYPIRAAFVSHDNIDHFNGLLNSPRSLGIRRVYITEYLMKDPSHAWIFVQEQLLEQDIEIIVIHAGDRIRFGDATAEVLWPPPNAAYESARDNNASLVLRWSVPTAHGDRSLLMSGDIEEEAMIELMDLYPDLQADIVEAPHHGSDNPQLSRFLEALDPMIVFQSTGRSRLRDWTTPSETHWYATADRGSSWALIKQDGTIESRWTFPD